MVLYFDFLDTAVNLCSPEEIGLLIIAAYHHQNGVDSQAIFSDNPKLQFAYRTLIDSIDRDTIGYFDKCFSKSLNKRFTDWKKASGSEGYSRERWEAENRKMIDQIKEEYEYAKQYALGNPLYEVENKYEQARLTAKEKSIRNL